LFVLNICFLATDTRRAAIDRFCETSSLPTAIDYQPQSIPGVSSWPACVFGIAFTWTQNLRPAAIAYAVYGFPFFLARSG
jgi:hypothetical protein